MISLGDSFVPLTHDPLTGDSLPPYSKTLAEDNRIIRVRIHKQ